MWGSKKNTNDEAEEQPGDNGDYGTSEASVSSRSGRNVNPGTRRDADERTQHLSGQRAPPPRNGYLDPDDPAVS